MKDLPGNHRIHDLTPGISIGCMDPEARALMELAEHRYSESCKRRGVSRSASGFMRWLFKDSGLVDDVEEQARKGYQEHNRQMRQRLKDHPNPRLRLWRSSVSRFAYWFFRWSALIDPRGKAVRSHA